jgi:glutathione S-transferase
MIWTAWVTLAALLVYLWMTVNVSRARHRFGIPAPIVDGPQDFMSVLRVQLNTVEQLALFLPALWLCAWAFDDRVAAAGGVLWTVGRVLYARAYYRDPKDRALGYGLTVVASFLLMLGAAWGLIIRP